ncbi:MAG: hypothetical protein ACI90V_006496, partial [Bacillariaceae sp.]
RNPKNKHYLVLNLPLDFGLIFVDVPIFIGRCRNPTCASWIMNLLTIPYTM